MFRDDLQIIFHFAILFGANVPVSNFDMVYHSFPATFELAKILIH